MFPKHTHSVIIFRRISSSQYPSTKEILPHIQLDNSPLLPYLIKIIIINLHIRYSQFHQTTLHPYHPSFSVPFLHLYSSFPCVSSFPFSVAAQMAAKNLYAFLVIFPNAAGSPQVRECERVREWVRSYLALSGTEKRQVILEKWSENVTDLRTKAKLGLQGRSEVVIWRRQC